MLYTFSSNDTAKKVENSLETSIITTFYRVMPHILLLPTGTGVNTSFSIYYLDLCHTIVWSLWDWSLLNSNLSIVYHKILCILLVSCIRLLCYSHAGSFDDNNDCNEIIHTFTDDVADDVICKLLWEISQKVKIK